MKKTFYSYLTYVVINPATSHTSILRMLKTLRCAELHHKIVRRTTSCKHIPSCDNEQQEYLAPVYHFSTAVEQRSTVSCSAKLATALHIATY